MDDIPEAIRERVDLPKSAPPTKFIFVGISLGAIALSLAFLLSRSPVDEQSKAPTTPAAPPSAVKQPTKPKPASTSASEPVDNLLGHLPYQEVSPTQLTPVTTDGRIRLQQKAAEKFKEMQSAAAAAGINLVPISGFRSVAEQDYLFFGVKEKRNQPATKRAEVSAPPGYSEHHTGYAMDIGDGNATSTNVNPEFEHTAAFKWLENNAGRYSFELSFPRNNPQGVSYEPWHWRYVGDRESLETFYKARNLKKTTN